MKNKRNYGLDLFRMFSMFCVIILHLLGHGGALETTKSNLSFATLWFWEAAAYPAVNSFVLLSGFVGYQGEKIYPKIRNIITIVFSTLFYSLASFLIYRFVFSQGTNIQQLVSAMLPTLTKQYWFVSAYVGMFLFSPVINLFVYKAERKMLVYASIVTLILAFFTLYKNPFSFNGGYSMVWFVLLYMLGAMIKKEDVLSNLSVSTSLICIATGLSVSLGTKLVFSLLGSPFSAYQNLFISYCSPTVLVMAIGWMAIFSKIKTTPVLNKIISYITPSVFPVYLIHDNPYIRKLFIANNFSFVNAYNPVTASGIILASAAVVFTACLLIDGIRVLSFKTLRIPQMTLVLENKIKTVFSIICKHLSA